MPQSKNKMPVIIGAVAFLAVAGGAMFYFSKNMTKDEVATAASEQMPAAAGGGETASGANNTGEPPATSEEQAEAAKAASGFGVEVKPGNPVVAKVDGQDVTRVDVFRYIKMMPANVQQLPPTALYPLALDQVINTRIVQNKAEEAKLENDPEVEQQMSMARQQIIRSVYVQRALEKQISESDMKAKYDEQIGKMPAVEEVKAAHILVDSEDKAKDIIAKLQEGGDFAKLASENSGDPGNKDKGGDLGWFAKGDMVPEFSEAAFNLGKGDISKEPVKTQFGWHVIKLEDKRDRPKPTYESVKNEIRTELSRAKLEAMLDDWRKVARIEKFDINGDPVKEQPDVAPAAGEVPAPGSESTPPAAQ